MVSFLGLGEFEPANGLVEWMVEAILVAVGKDGRFAEGAELTCLVPEDGFGGGVAEREDEARRKAAIVEELVRRDFVEAVCVDVSS